MKYTECGIESKVIKKMILDHLRSFLGCASGKEYSCESRRCKRSEFNPWVRKIPYRRKWYPTSVLLPGKFLGQRSLGGYSPWWWGVPQRLGHN